MAEAVERAEGLLALETYLNGLVEFTEEEMQLVLSRFEPLHIPAGDFMVDEGLVCTHIGFLVRGYMRSYYEVSDSEVTNMIMRRHQVVTSYSSFSKQSSSIANIQAISDCDLLVISYAAMQELYRTLPKWERLGRLIMEDAYGFTESRVLDYLSLSPEERYRKIVTNTPRLLKEVPLRYIASMLGITPETLSRIRNKVHRK